MTLRESSRLSFASELILCNVSVTVLANKSVERS